jgi:hypothetical protein
MADRCCDDVAIHQHGDQTYRDGKPYRWRFAFEWRRPTIRRTRPADYRRIALHLNRYPGVVIGIHLQLGQRGWSLLWGRPGRIIDLPARGRR